MLTQTKVSCGEQGMRPITVFGPSGRYCLTRVVQTLTACVLHALNLWPKHCTPKEAVGLAVEATIIGPSAENAKYGLATVAGLVAASPAPYTDVLGRTCLPEIRALGYKRKVQPWAKLTSILCASSSSN
ncbi:hypothetical protein BC939DRAFT_473805 [Gamsiella multidivaricata]|uniref:uncharacterized protein n=1 Tax=Gamsiella multidivaricata TaxID=101098 RepID=UPI0022206E3A|nr:uncharacterized protein BC939DRAFT_473805 [Gamsiella multidivaricata]KAI7830235.1 hypothetical protein BC939DRAFT_473805 [Gamsiella multidivaricata]